MNSISEHTFEQTSQGYPLYKETSVPVWDVTAKIISVVFAPFTLISNIFSKNNGKRPPQANGHAILGSLPEFAAMKWDTLNFITAYHHKHGMSDGISRLKLFNKIFYIISDPEKAKKILNKPSAFVRGQSLKVWQKFSKGGLSEGQDTQKYRGQAVKAIGPSEIEHYFSGIVNVSSKWIERLDQVEHLNIMKEMERATLAAMAESLFKMDPSDPAENNPFGLEKSKDEMCFRFLNAYHNLFEALTRRITSGLASVPYVGDSLYSWYYPEDDATITKAKETMYEILTPIFENLLKDPDKIKPESHLRTLFQHFNIDPYHADIDDLIEKCLGFLQAAFETSSKALGWTLFALASDLTLQDKLREELLSRFNGQPPSNLSELKEIHLLSQVMEESLRLFPPFPFLLRDIVEPGKFEDYEVEKGGTFVISPLLIHQNPLNWKDPLVFDPERFSEEMLEDKWQIRNPKYMTFLGGMHRCPGRFFGKQEILIFLCQFLQNYRITLPKTDEDTRLKLSITLQPSEPLIANLEKIHPK